jgi:hypothetical protein
VSWNYIIKLAASIFVAQSVIGFLDGLFGPSSHALYWTLGSHTVSILVCGAIFAIFAFRQPFKPISHALVALLVCQITGLALVPVYVAWLGSMISSLPIIVDLLVLVCALIIGTLTGISLRRITESQPNA